MLLITVTAACKACGGSIVKDVRVCDLCTRRWSVCAKGYIKSFEM